MSGGRVRADAGTKAGFPVINSPDNGERARSLLCDREALAKPPGAAEISSKGSDLTRSGTAIPGGCRAEPDQEDLACRRYSKDTSCPAVLSPARSGGNDKTFPVRVSYCLPSASVTVCPLLVMGQYLSAAFVVGDLTGKKPRFYGLIKRRSGRIHAFKPERCFSLAESGQAQFQCPIISHGFSFEQSCE